MYIIQELQTTNNQTALVTPVTKSDRAQAENAFLTACAAACISQVEVHTVLWYDEHGNVIDRKFYEHLSEPSA